MKFLKEKGKRKDRKGFTLVELLVAISVFVVIVTFSLGAVVSILDAGRKARSLKAMMTNLNFALEVMSREIKFGTNYHCGTTSSFPPSPQNCTGGGVPAGSSVSFVSSEGVDTIYRLNNSRLEKSSDGGTSYVGVTAPEIVVQDLKFFVFNSAPQSDLPADNAQPRVVMLIRGYAGNKPSIQSNFSIQTTVSQRALDI